MTAPAEAGDHPVIVQLRLFEEVEEVAAPDPDEDERPRVEVENLTRQEDRA